MNSFEWYTLFDAAVTFEGFGMPTRFAHTYTQIRIVQNYIIYMFFFFDQKLKTLVLMDIDSEERFPYFVGNATDAVFRPRVQRYFLINVVL